MDNSGSWWVVEEVRIHVQGDGFEVVESSPDSADNPVAAIGSSGPGHTMVEDNVEVAIVRNLGEDNLDL